MSEAKLSQAKNAAIPAQSTASQFQSRPFMETETNEESIATSNHSFEGIAIAPPPSVQAKLTIGQPGDPYEQEADQMAAQVVEQINSPQTVQRQSLMEKELQMKPHQPRTQTNSGGLASEDLEKSIQTAQGQGRPLSDNIRSSMEQAFGVDFSRVKVHTDSRSNQLNETVQAKAFATGQDIFFKEGEYQPESHSGQELLAHELTHVVQQNQNIGLPGSSLESSVGLEKSSQSQTSPIQTQTIQCAVEEDSIWTLLNTVVGDAGSVGGGAGLMNDISTAFRSSALPTIAPYLGPLGLVTGAIGAADPNSSMSDRIAGGASSFSGAVSTANTVAGLFGSSNLFAAGGTAGAAGLNASVGTAFGAGASSTGVAATTALGSAGAVAGAGAAGYGIGRLLDRGVGELMNFTGLSASIDEQKGIRRPEGQHGDYSLSGMMAEDALGRDQRFTSIMRDIGVYDEDEPAYTQTIGWRLGELLGI